MTGKVGQFGPMVIGQAQYRAEQAIVEKGTNVYGSLVTGETSSGAKANLSAAGQVDSPANLDLFRKALLAADQRGADALLAAELARADGPRKTALNLLLEAEQAREKPRPEWLETINRTLATIT